jgi:hypothetical protein
MQTLFFHYITFSINEYWSFSTIHSMKVNYTIDQTLNVRDRSHTLISLAKLMKADEILFRNWIMKNMED